MAILFLLVAVVLGLMAYRVSLGMGMHLVTALFLALIPLVATYVVGLIGLLASAVFVGGLYKASAG
jgi:hypothetical protein